MAWIYTTSEPTSAKAWQVAIDATQLARAMGHPPPRWQVWRRPRGGYWLVRWSDHPGPDDRIVTPDPPEPPAHAARRT